MAQLHLVGGRWAQWARYVRYLGRSRKSERQGNAVDPTEYSVEDYNDHLGVLELFDRLSCASTNFPPGLTCAFQPQTTENPPGVIPSARYACAARYPHVVEWGAESVYCKYMLRGPVHGNTTRADTGVCFGRRRSGNHETGCLMVLPSVLAGSRLWTQVLGFSLCPKLSFE